VLALPISDVIADPMFEPTVCDTADEPLGFAKVPWVGAVSKSHLTVQAGSHAPASMEVVDMSLRVALAL